MFSAFAFVPLPWLRERRRALVPGDDRMTTRRELLQIAAAAAGLSAIGGGFWRAVAQQRLSQQDLLRFSPKGQVTLLHMTDLHAQLVPVYFREQSINVGVGEMKGEFPHITGDEF